MQRAPCGGMLRLRRADMRVQQRLISISVPRRKADMLCCWIGDTPFFEGLKRVHRCCTHTLHVGLTVREGVCNLRPLFGYTPGQNRKSHRDIA